MAEERNLGLARASESYGEGDPSKEELQRRMDKARDSISHTVTEIKDTVANQVQAVKETLDWREHYKKRPGAWSVGAVGVGFLVGYGLAAIAKGDSHESSGPVDYYAPRARAFTSQSSVSAPQAAPQQDNGNGHEGPGFFEKLSHTPAYGRVKDEASNIGDAVLQELSKTAKQVVLPALITSLRNFIGDYLPKASPASANAPNSSSGAPQSSSSYQPTLDRGQG
jgi:ElaB/YqjD/DUF883 family membrane-anchored ribosome-binding protein